MSIRKLLIPVLTTLVLGTSAHAQNTSLLESMAPQRGIVPGGSYSLDKIENINNVTGTLGLRIPVAT